MATDLAPSSPPTTGLCDQRWVLSLSGPQFPCRSGSGIWPSGIITGLLLVQSRLCGRADPLQGFHHLSLEPRGEECRIGLHPVLA